VRAEVSIGTSPAGRLEADLAVHATDDAVVVVVVVVVVEAAGPVPGGSRGIVMATTPRTGEAASGRAEMLDLGRRRRNWMPRWLITLAAQRPRPQMGMPKLP